MWHTRNVIQYYTNLNKHIGVDITQKGVPINQMEEI